MDASLVYQECVSKIMNLAKKSNVPFVVDGVSSDIYSIKSRFDKLSDCFVF